MSEETYELHPIVAALSAAMERTPDHTGLLFPEAALEKARAQIRASDDTVVLHHLLALAAKIKRIVGPQAGESAIEILTQLVIEKLGNKKAASDMLEHAGMHDEATALLGTTKEVRAPREEKKAAPTVKAKRGLR